jgi:hypothetical protein
VQGGRVGVAAAARVSAAGHPVSEGAGEREGDAGEAGGDLGGDGRGAGLLGRGRRHVVIVAAANGKISHSGLKCRENREDVTCLGARARA